MEPTVRIRRNSRSGLYSHTGVKYWVTIQSVFAFSGVGQWGWSTNGGNDDILHEEYQDCPLLGMNYWTTTTNGDQAFQLYSGAPTDTTPPVTTCVITGTNPVTITLTATDDMSGVNFTKYKIDDGAYATYTAPVVGHRSSAIMSSTSTPLTLPAM